MRIGIRDYLREFCSYKSMGPHGLLFQGCSQVLERPLSTSVKGHGGGLQEVLDDWRNAAAIFRKG